MQKRFLGVDEETNKFEFLVGDELITQTAEEMSKSTYFKILIVGSGSNLAIRKLIQGMKEEGI